MTKINYHGKELVEFWEDVFNNNWHLRSSATISDKHYGYLVNKLFEKWTRVKSDMKVLKLDMYNEATSTRYSNYYMEKGVDVFFSEISKSIGKQAKKMIDEDGFGSFAHPTQSDFRMLPFKDESFDVSCSFGSIEHTPDWEKSLAEQIRVVKKGGIIMVGVPNLYNIWGRYPLNVLMDKLGLLEKCTNFEIHFTPQRLRKAVIKHGLKNVEVTGYHSFPKLLRWVDLLTKHRNEKLNKIYSKLIGPGLSFCTNLETKGTRLNLLAEMLIAVGVK